MKLREVGWGGGGFMEGRSTGSLEGRRLTTQRPLSSLDHHPSINSTQAIFPFPLDDFQTKALEALGQRENVVVSAPTGSGAF